MKRFFEWMCVAFLCLSASMALAQSTALERAGEIKAWRDQCNHPDPDLRLAYLEAALETKDESIERICIRSALKNDNNDVRNLGLRAAIASFDQLSFDVEMPPQLAKYIEEADGDSDRLNEIGDWYITQDYNVIQNGMVFEIKGASVSKGQSTWFPLGGRSNSHKNLQGEATIVGERLRWIGLAKLARDWTCTLDVGLNAAGELEGFFQCRDLWPFPVKASLL